MLDSQIGEYKRLDWSQLGTEDLLRARAQFDQLKDQRAEIDKSIQAKREQFQGQVQNATREVLAAGAKYIAQRVPGFNTEVQQELMQYGVTDGYLQDELSRITDPRFIVTLHKAMQWDRLQASAPGVRNKAARAAPVVRPGASIKQPSRVQALSQNFKKATTPQTKKAAAEDYFTARFGG
ncbi:MAG: hypothetical protein E4H01_08310 [Lysobacterales bacterium]|nr:MAG: hypothetical protein E4H01_08310 [Xanthomonadales bacterium]